MSNPGKIQDKPPFSFPSLRASLTAYNDSAKNTGASIRHLNDLESNAVVH